MKQTIEVMNPFFLTSTQTYMQISAYEGRNEVGRLKVNAAVVHYKKVKTCQIDEFWVKEDCRRKGVGRELMYRAEKEIVKYGGDSISVYPNPTDCGMSPEDIYMIYKKLGFGFTEATANEKLTNQHMEKIL